MFARVRRLTGWSLFAIYGGIALLGHAGMHALQGDHHHHAHPHPVAARAEHAHTHSGCGHRHTHSTASQHDGPQSDHQHDQQPHGPSHDQDDCLVCQYFAAKAFVFSPPAPLNLAAGIEQARCASTPVVDAADAYVLPIRGPPGRCA